MCYLASFAVKVNSTAHCPTEERNTKIGLGIFRLRKIGLDCIKYTKIVYSKYK